VRAGERCGRIGTSAGGQAYKGAGARGVSNAYLDAYPGADILTPRHSRERGNPETSARCRGEALDPQTSRGCFGDALDPRVRGDDDLEGARERLGVPCFTVSDAYPDAGILTPRHSRERGNPETSARCRGEGLDPQTSRGCFGDALDPRLRGDDDLEGARERLGLPCFTVSDAYPGAGALTPRHSRERGNPETSARCRGEALDPQTSRGCFGEALDPRLRGDDDPEGARERLGRAVFYRNSRSGRRGLRPAAANQRLRRVYCSRGSTLTRICPSCTRAVSRSPGAASSTLRTTRPSSCWTMA